MTPGRTAATTTPWSRRTASGSSGRCRPAITLGCSLAIPARDYRVVDEDRYRGLTFVDTTVTALGVTRRAVLTHSANLHAKQARGLDQTLAKARRRLAELQARLARGRTRRDRAAIQAQPRNFTVGQTVGRVGLRRLRAGRFDRDSGVVGSRRRRMSCGDAGFHGPGGGCSFLGLSGREAGGQGMARTRLKASANCCAQGQVSGIRRISMREWLTRRAAVCSSR